MEIDNPHGDFLITCSHGVQDAESILVARIAGNSEILTERNAGGGIHQVGTSFVAEDTESQVAHFKCPKCPYDVQLQPGTLRSFVSKLRMEGLSGADLSLLQSFATH